MRPGAAGAAVVAVVFATAGVAATTEDTSTPAAAETRPEPTPTGTLGPWPVATVTATPPTATVTVTETVTPKPSPSPSRKRAPEPASRSTREAGAPTSGVWAQLAACESSGNPRAVDPSGTYFGLYQFDLATWRSVGGSGYPHHASAAEQTRRAQRLQADRGWQPWPVCSRRLGLLP